MRRGGGNAFPSCTNYFPDSIATHLHLLTQLTCISLLTPQHALRRTHAPHALRSTSHSRASRVLTKQHAHPCTHAFLCLLLLFYCHRIVHRYVCPRQYNLNQHTDMNPTDMNALEYAAYVRFSLFLLMGGCTLILACFAVSIHSDWRKSNRK